MSKASLRTGSSCLTSSWLGCRPPPVRDLFGRRFRVYVPYRAHHVDHFVAEYYLREVKLDAERVAALQPRLVETFRLTAGYREAEAARHRRNVENIEGQRHQLVSDHVKNPGAIPLDVLAQQQADLAEKLKAAQKELRKAEADLGKAEKGLRLARKFLEDSSGTYRDQAAR